MLLGKLPALFNDAIADIENWPRSHDNADCTLATASNLLQCAQRIHARTNPNAAGSSRAPKRPRPTNDDEAGPSNRPGPSSRPPPPSPPMDPSATSAFGAAMLAAVTHLTHQVSKMNQHAGRDGRGRGRGRGVHNYTRGKAPNYGPIVCWRCNKPGHFAFECSRRGPPPPPPPSGSGGSGGFCGWVGWEGRPRQLKPPESRACPSPQPPPTFPLNPTRTQYTFLSGAHHRCPAIQRCRRSKFSAGFRRDLSHMLQPCTHALNQTLS